MSILRTATAFSIALAIPLLHGCNSDSAEKFNGEWVQIVGSDNKFPDKVAISCDTKTCEWKFNSGYSAYMRGGYNENPSVKHLIMTNGKLDFGMGRTASIEDGKLYFAGNVFSKQT